MLALTLTLSSIRGRIGNLVGALVAIVAAVSLISATGILILSVGNTSLDADRFDNAAVVVQFDPYWQPANPADLIAPANLAGTGPRLPTTLVPLVASAPGVQVAVSDVTFYAQLVDSDGAALRSSNGSDSYGMPWESAVLAPFILSQGTAPSAEKDVVIDGDLAQQSGFKVGDSVVILSRDLPTPYRVSGIATLPSGPGLERQASIFFRIDTASRLANADGLVADIGVIGVPGIDASQLAENIRTKVDQPGIRVLTGSDKALADPTSDWETLDGTTSVLAVMAAFASVVAMFVLAGTFAFSVQLRTRELGLLRAIGMTPGQVRRMIALEALVLTIVGVIVAVPLSLVLAIAYGQLLVRFELAPKELTPSFSFWPFVIAFTGGVLITQVAVFATARRASRIRPIAALREASAPTRVIGFGRFIAGVIFVIAGFVAMGMAASTKTDAVVPLGFLQTLLFLIAAAILGPLIAMPFSWVIGKLLSRLTDAPGYLAEWGSRRSPQRVASVAAPLILAVGFACLMFSMTATIEAGTIGQSQDRITGQLVVVANSAGLPAATVSEVARIPGVRAVAGTVATDFVLVQQHSDYTDYWGYSGVIADPAPLSQVLDLDVTAGSLDALQGRSIALSRLGAGQIGASVGDSYEIRLDDNTIQRLRVVAIYGNSLGFGDAILPSDLLMDRTRTPLVQQMYVSVADGADPTTVQQQISGLGQAIPTLHVLDVTSYTSGIKQSTIQGAQAFYLLIGISVLFAVLSVINTMTMSTSQRVREFALLRLVGSTPRQLRTMVVCEAVVILGIGVALGFAISVSGIFTLGRGMTGDASSLSIPGAQTLAVIAIAAVIAIVAHVVPANAVLGVRPVDNIGTRE